MLLPLTALAIACRMAQLVKEFVDRPRQVAIVKGLKRYLEAQLSNETFDYKAIRRLTLTQWQCYPIAAPS